MIALLGSARNINALMVYGIDRPVGFVEVVLLCEKTFYGRTSDGEIVKGGEITDLRFNASPEALRTLSSRLLRYADESEEAFGRSPDVKEETDETITKQPEPVSSSEPEML